MVHIEHAHLPFMRFCSAPSVHFTGDTQRCSQWRACPRNRVPWRDQVIQIQTNSASLVKSKRRGVGRHKAHTQHCVSRKAEVVWPTCGHDLLVGTAKGCVHVIVYTSAHACQGVVALITCVHNNIPIHEFCCSTLVYTRTFRLMSSAVEHLCSQALL